MSDRFDFEQKIMRCWNVTDDIQEVLDANDRQSLTQDELMNALVGLKTIYQMKFENLFAQFEDMVKQKKIT